MKKPKPIKVYLSGQISKLPPFLPELLFEQAEWEIKERITKKGRTAKVVNPIKIIHKPGSSWSNFMVKDIEALFICSHVYMLTNWRKSRGAKIEHYIALVTRKTIIYQREK